MLMISVAVFCLVGLGMLAMAWRSIAAEPPLDYHGRILGKAQDNPSVHMVLGALCKALGLGVLLLALTGIRSDVFSTKLTVLLMVLVAGGVATMATRRVEEATAVGTPWRIAAGLMALGLIGFVLSVL